MHVGRTPNAKGPTREQYDSLGSAYDLRRQPATDRIPSYPSQRLSWTCNRCNKTIVRPYNDLVKGKGCDCLTPRVIIQLARQLGWRPKTERHVPMTANTRITWVCVAGEHPVADRSFAEQARLGGCPACLGPEQADEQQLMPPTGKDYERISGAQSIRLAGEFETRAGLPPNWVVAVMWRCTDPGCQQAFRASFDEADKNGCSHCAERRARRNRPIITIVTPMDSLLGGA
jgi:hypothetical protein